MSLTSDELINACAEDPQLYEEVLEMLPDSIKGLVHSGVAMELTGEFEETGSAETLARAITATELALQWIDTTTPADARNGLLLNLGTLLLRRYETTGSLPDLERAITLQQQAGSSIATDSPLRGAFHNELSVSLLTRFEQKGSMKDLDRAIGAINEAISSASSHSDRSVLLNNKAMTLQTRFEQTGSIEDLTQAIAALDEALFATPHDEPNRPALLTSLGNALQRQFEWTRSMDSIERAIAALNLAISLTPKDDPRRVGRLGNLGTALHTRFKRTRSLNDLTEAIKVRGEAVKHTPEGHPQRPGYLSMLGNSLHERFLETGSISDLNEAIRVQREAVATNTENVDRAGWFNNLGISLQTRSKKTGSLDDLNEAIFAKEQAVQLTPGHHPNRTMWLTNLGTVFRDRFELYGSESDLDRAIELNEEALAISAAAPVFRIRAADWASSMLIGRDWHRANKALQEAVKLLPSMSPRTLSQTDRQHSISLFAGITSRSVSVSLQCGDDTYKALQLLELGRGVLANLQLEVRSDISVLEDSYPEIARKFRNIRAKLDSPESSERFEYTTSEDITQKHPDPRISLSNEFDEFVEAIRMLPGQERFLLGPSEAEMKHLAEGGPVVAFNVSGIRSDAFIITPHSIQSLKLSSLRQSDLKENSARFLTAIRSLSKEDYMEARHELTSVLQWLWEAAISPCLEVLALTATPSDQEQWPRIWWIGNGLLNLLPLHAAGLYDGSSNNAMDKVISSYAPTIKALMYSRERQAKILNVEGQNVLLVGMPETPEHDSLSSVTEELQMIKSLIPSNVAQTLLRPTRKDVLEELKAAEIVHLACHGISMSDPSKSMLLLEDWRTSPLTVLDITSANLQKSRFAYLSACNTASIEDHDLLDESINLVSAMQLAGFPSVVGTLWQVTDQHAGEVARDVYNWMLGEGNKFDNLRSAEGLHFAIRHLRHRTRITPGHVRLGQDDPIIWAPYIHSGI